MLETNGSAPKEAATDQTMKLSATDQTTKLRFPKVATLRPAGAPAAPAPVPAAAPMLAAAPALAPAPALATEAAKIDAVEIDAIESEPVEVTPAEVSAVEAPNHGRLAIEAAPPRANPAAGALEREVLQVLPGFEKLASAWWDAVTKVHQTLLLSEAELEIVCAVFAEELQARWEYAKALHEGGFQVPDYLAERAPIAPLWPLPALPIDADRLTYAA
ncbi:MAG: hypothetical protein ACRDTQ_20765 [Micromonosporaceae bacterium]